MDRDLERLGRLVKQTQHQQHRAIDLALAPLGTTIVQWDALRAIGAMAGASGHDLAVATFQTDQAFGTLATRLIAQGLIERRPGAGRKLDYRLTASGETMLAAANLIVDAGRIGLYAGLSTQDRQALEELLLQLRDSQRAFSAQGL